MKKTVFLFLTVLLTISAFSIKAEEAGVGELIDNETQAFYNGRHYQMENELPDDFSIMHTGLSDYPFKPLAVVGVAFKLLQALIGDDSLEYADVVALGTVADMMPLVDENRAIVNIGLKRMANSCNWIFNSNYCIYLGLYLLYVRKLFFIGNL